MNARIRLVHLDGKLPNLALMKLSAWHKRQGHEVTASRSIHPQLFEPAEYDAVYGSTLFEKSHARARELLTAYRDAVIGGTGTLLNKTATIESTVGEDTFEVYDYEIYPQYEWSLGFTQR